MRLGFSKLLEKICIYLLGVHLKKSAKDSFYDVYVIVVFLFVFFFLIFFIKAYVVGTHLNCIDKSMQFKWVPTTYAFMKKETKVHWL